jgi:ferrochelatase
MPTKTGLVLVAHGTVDALDDLPEFLTNIRRGHAPTPELLHEVRRRYEAIGSSPLNAINLELAGKLGAKLGLPARMANRLFRPYPKQALEELAAEGVTEVVVVPLAQHSAKLYGDAVVAASKEVPGIARVVAPANWGRSAALSDAFAASIVSALEKVPAEEGSRTAVILTAHSLPVAVVQAGDPYEEEVRGSAAEVIARVTKLAPTRFATHAVAFQSQGMSSGPGGRPVQWLGPDLRAALEDAKAKGMTHVIVAPIGFLADHVEILYDLDIEAQGWAGEIGLTLVRSSSLNASEAMVETLAGVCAPLLDELGKPEPPRGG